MGFWNTASAWAKAEGGQLGRSTASYGGMVKENAPSMWKQANMASNGFLNPTAMGMGVGGAVGGTVGAASDNGSFLGGFAGGAMLGGLGGAGFRSGQMGISKYKTGTYTNPENIAGKYSSWAPGATGYSSPVGRSGGSYHTGA